MRPLADDDALDRVFRALGDRTRRALLTRLARGPCRVTQLAEPFDMSLVAVSKHLKVLERAGLIQRAIDGRVHQCSLDPAPLGDAQQWLHRNRTFWEASLDRLAALVEGDTNE